MPAVLNCKVFASEFISASAANVIAPDMIFVPVELLIFRITPSLLIPVPLIVMASGIFKLAPSICNAAPVFTIVFLAASAELPKAALFCTLTTPAFIVVTPV